MEEKWVVAAKKADFGAIGEHFGIDPVIARIMRNRDLTDIDEMEIYLHGGREDLFDPHLLKDADRAAAILGEKIRQGRRIRIIGDYDIDGIMSTYILSQAMERIGADADTVIPDRVQDGYGLNEHLVTQAASDGIDTILTCDNGIAAVEQVRLAKELGMTVIVTDHHEIPHGELPAADAIVNPKQQDCNYPFSGLCGAAVAFKLVQVLYAQEGIPVGEADRFLEFAGFATVGDVMDLNGENRVLAKLGISMLRETGNLGMRALILRKKVDPKRLTSYHIGFVLGPCLNASGRLETAQLSLQLLTCSDAVQAAVMAEKLSDINDTRKQMTEQAVLEARSLIDENGYDRDRVMVLFLPDCHESLAGLVAGKIRESYHRPVLVVTRAEECCKGSGRSIPEYSMFEEMSRCADLFIKFGGHPMAAGFSIEEDNIAPLRKRLNDLAALTDEDLMPTVHIDMVMPIDYVRMDLIRQLELLEPFGKGNEKPVFADRDLEITSLRILGKEGRVIRMRLMSPQGRSMDAVYFGDPENLRLSLEQKYDILTAEDTVAGKCTHHASLNFTYYPEIDDYFDEPRIQLKITGFRG